MTEGDSRDFNIGAKNSSSDISESNSDSDDDMIGLGNFDMVASDIVRLPAKSITSEIAQIKKGEHSVLVYPDLQAFRQVYPNFCKKMLDDNDIVVCLTYYEPVDNVLEQLAHTGIDTDRHRRQGNLIVADAVEEFFGKQKDFLLFLLTLERKVKKLGKNCVSVVVSMSVFHLYDKEEEMIEYEGLLDMSEARNWRVLCCYHQGDYNRLSEQLKQELLSRHNRRLFVI